MASLMKWVGRLRPTGGPIRADLGEENKFYFNKELNAWVLEGEEEQLQQKLKKPKPPPTSLEMQKKREERDAEEALAWEKQRQADENAERNRRVKTSVLDTLTRPAVVYRPFSAQTKAASAAPIAIEQQPTEQPVEHLVCDQIIVEQENRAPSMPDKSPQSNEIPVALLRKLPSLNGEAAVKKMSSYFDVLEGTTAGIENAADLFAEDNIADNAIWLSLVEVFSVKVSEVLTGCETFNVQFQEHFVIEVRRILTEVVVPEVKRVFERFAKKHSQLDEAQFASHLSELKRMFSILRDQLAAAVDTVEVNADTTSFTREVIDTLVAAIPYMNNMFSQAARSVIAQDDFEKFVRERAVVEEALIVQRNEAVKVAENIKATLLELTEGCAQLQDHHAGIQALYSDLKNEASQLKRLHLARVTALGNEKAAITIELHKKQRIIEDLSNKLEDTRRKYQDLEYGNIITVEKYQSEIAALKAACAAEAANLQHLQATLIELEASRDAAAAIWDNEAALLGKLETHTVGRTVLEKERAIVQADEAARAKVIENELNNQLHRVEEAMSATAQELEVTRKSLQERSDAADAAQRDLEGQVAHARQELAMAEDAAQHFESEVDRLQSELEHARKDREKLGAIEQTLTKLREALIEAEAAKDLKEKRAEAAEAALAERNVEATRLQSALESALRDCQNHEVTEQALNEMREALIEAEVANDVERKRVAAAEVALAEKSAEVIRLQNELENAMKERGSHEMTEEMLRKALGEAETAKDFEAKRAGDAEAALAERTEEVTRLQNELESALKRCENFEMTEQALNRMREALVDAQAAKNVQEKRTEAAENATAELSIEIARLRDELENAMKDRENLEVIEQALCEMREALIEAEAAKDTEEKRAEAAEAALAEVTSVANRLQCDLENMLKDRENLRVIEQALSEMQEALIEVEAAKDAEEKRAKAAEAIVAERTAEATRLSSEVQSLNSVIESLKAEHATVIASKDATLEQLESLASRNKTLSESLQEQLVDFQAETTDIWNDVSLLREQLTKTVAGNALLEEFEAEKNSIVTQTRDELESSLTATTIDQKNAQNRISELEEAVAELLTSCEALTGRETELQHELDAKSKRIEHLEKELEAERAHDKDPQSEEYASLKEELAVERKWRAELQTNLALQDEQLEALQKRLTEVLSADSSPAFKTGDVPADDPTQEELNSAATASEYIRFLEEKTRLREQELEEAMGHARHLRAMVNLMGIKWSLVQSEAWQTAVKIDAQIPKDFIATHEAYLRTHDDDVLRQKRQKEEADSQKFERYYTSCLPQKAVTPVPEEAKTVDNVVDVTDNGEESPPPFTQEEEGSNDVVAASY